MPKPRQYARIKPDPETILDDAGVANLQQQAFMRFRNTTGEVQPHRESFKQGFIAGLCAIEREIPGAYRFNKVGDSE